MTSGALILILAHIGGEIQASPEECRRENREDERKNARELNMEPYPLKFEPVYIEKIWGGRNLERLFDRPLPPRNNIGESWEIADMGGSGSVVANGPLAGRSLSALIRDTGSLILGRKSRKDSRGFPLLLKLLDANDILSLQVHPDRDAAARIGGGAVPKTECWYVLESRGGYIYKDLVPGTTREAFAAALTSGGVERLVRRIDCAAGDFFYLPAGTVHALGAGLVVAEIQTPSDTTFRVTDWGRGREIHVDESLACIDFDAAAAGEEISRAEDGPVLSTNHFDVHLKSGAAGSAVGVNPAGCTCLMIIRGSGDILTVGGGSGEVAFGAGDTLLLPHALPPATMRLAEDARWIEIGLPDSRDNE